MSLSEDKLCCKNCKFFSKGKEKAESKYGWCTNWTIPIERVDEWNLCKFWKENVEKPIYNWEQIDEENYACSNCGRRVRFYEGDIYDYCPHCGVKMNKFFTKLKEYKESPINLMPRPLIYLTKENKYICERCKTSCNPDDDKCSFCGTRFNGIIDDDDIW